MPDGVTFQNIPQHDPVRASRPIAKNLGFLIAKPPRISVGMLQVEGTCINPGQGHFHPITPALGFAETAIIDAREMFELAQIWL